jgi:amino acid transporter
MPGSGGSYRYLKEIYGAKLGRLISFLFIWQLSFSAPLSIASGCVGFAKYASYYWQGFDHVWKSQQAILGLPLIGRLQVRWEVMPATFLAIGVCALAVVLLYRRITAVGQLSKLLWVGVMGTMAWIIFAGLTHFNAKQAFDFPPGAFTLSQQFFHGLGAGMLIAAYDYWGYYNVCFLGDEIKDPVKTFRGRCCFPLRLSPVYIL